MIIYKYFSPIIFYAPGGDIALRLFLIFVAFIYNLIPLFFLHWFLHPRKKILPAVGFCIPPLISAVFAWYPGIILNDSGDFQALLLYLCLDVLVVFSCYTNSAKEKLKWAIVMAILQFLPVLPALFPLQKYIYAYIQPEDSASVSAGLPYLTVQLSWLFVSMLLAGCAVILYRLYQKNLSLQSALLFFLFVITQVLLMTSLLTRVYQKPSLAILYFCLGAGITCVIADFYVVKAFREISRKASLKQQAYFYQQQLDIQLKHYEKLSEYDRSLSHIRHDLKNEISTIQYLLQHREYQTAAALIDEIRDNIHSLEMVDCCENKIVSALIFIYYQQMNDAGIELFCDDLEIPQDIPMAMDKFCRELSRILDAFIQDRPKQIRISGHAPDTPITVTALHKKDSAAQSSSISFVS